VRGAVSTVDYDPRRPEIIADPYPAFAALRARDPVHWSDALGGWVLTRYDDVKAALTDPRLSADRISPFVRHRAASGRPVPNLARIVGNWAVFADPPRHTRLRGLLNRAFTPRAVAARAGRIAALVEGLIDRLNGRGDADLVAEFAYPLPVMVIADMIGVPPADQALFKEWSDELATFVGSGLLTDDKYARAERAAADMADYFRAVVGERRRALSPQEDLLSALISAEDRGDVLNEDELIATCVLLLFAGHETTTNLIANAVYWLLRCPDQWARLTAEPSLDESAVEEALRYDGPTQAMVRVVASDLTLGGQLLATGQRVFAMINAANRDPAIFEDPDRLDIARWPNRHIAFGHGIHFCLGAPLARLEGRIALRALARRLSQPALSDQRVDWLDSLVFRGMRSLPLRFAGIV